MNGVQRFLSRREKFHEKRFSKHKHTSSNPKPTVSSEVYRVFSNDDQKSPDKEAEKKVKMLLQRLQKEGITGLKEKNIEHAIAWHPDDIDKAYDLLLLANESLEGVLKDYNPNVEMLGAVNRNMVTCYLDALLFAMFARLDSFEAMLYDDFNDEPRKKLAAVLRLWVNMLRTGRLIKVDLTKQLQECLAECGWEEAARIRQQDTSEAFTFITGALELPLLTLKMDIYHTGRENQEDDHKFVNERLLEVAIPEPQGDKGVALEDCLEDYFNNRIEVKRYLRRQNTITSMHSSARDPEKTTEKNDSIHVETVELLDPYSPITSTPTSLGPSSPVHAAPSMPVRPLQGRRRGDSIFTERTVSHEKPTVDSPFDEKKLLDEILNKGSGGRPRSASFAKKEVMMPAWQFFSLIPWYTDSTAPKTDAQVAAHFSSKRPVLGICLKRYTMHDDGTPKRLDTYVDIPLEIGLPSFISDDRMEDSGPLFGNFKLVLQSVVCHRGVSVDSGHYVSFARANKPSSQARPPSSARPEYSDSEDEQEPDTWLRFDDLANPRVIETDIHKALREESPYLLFFQVQPIDEDLASRGDPPPYAEAPSDISTTDPSIETADTEITISTVDDIKPKSSSLPDTDRIQVDSGDDSEPPGRDSVSSNNRNSLTIAQLGELNNSANGLPRGRATGPPTPDERPGFLSTASRRNSRAWLASSLSRSGSQSGENRLSFTLSRLAGRGSKEKLQAAEANANIDDPVIIIDEVQTADSVESPPKPSFEKDKKDGSIPSRSKSKKEKKDEKKRLRSKSREPPSTEGVPTTKSAKGKRKIRERPDRECAVM